MFEKELLDAMDIKRDENVDQMIQKTDAAINKLLDYFSAVEVSECNIVHDTESLKNLDIARKILVSEKLGYDLMNRIKEF